MSYSAGWEFSLESSPPLMIAVQILASRTLIDIEISILAPSVTNPDSNLMVNHDTNSHTVAQKSVPMFACFSLKSITPNRI